jgi:hypothetical protein
MSLESEGGMIYWQGKTEKLGRKICPSATLSTTYPTWIHPGLQVERPATNRLSHGTASILRLVVSVCSCIVFISAICLSKRFRNAKNDPKFGLRGVVLVMQIPGKKCSGTSFRLASFCERTSKMAFRRVPSQKYVWFKWISLLQSPRIRKSICLFH